MHSIEPSKSSRAGCRTCKQKIGKGEPRLGVEESFSMRGDQVTSKKWHHLKCGMEKLPEIVLQAEIIPEVTSRGKPISLTEEDISTIEAFKEKYNTSGVAILSISDVGDADKTVNITAKVLRKLRGAIEQHESGEKMKHSKVYVEDEGHRSIIHLWGDHTRIEMNRDDTIVILEARSFVASNDNIQFTTTEDSTVMVNPSDDDIDDNVEQIELYISDAWERPTGKPAEFQFAPSGRANCAHCRDKINMGELKVVKPEYIEIANGRSVPGNVSFHLMCMAQDEVGMEVLHEAASRLNLDLINDAEVELQQLHDSLRKSPAKKLLDQLL